MSLSNKKKIQKPEAMSPVKSYQSLSLNGKLQHNETALTGLLELMRRSVDEVMNDKLHGLEDLIAEIPPDQMQLANQWNRKVTNLWNEFVRLGGKADAERGGLPLAMSTSGGHLNSSNQSGSSSSATSEDSVQSMENKSGSKRPSTSRQSQSPLSMPSRVAPIRKRNRTSVCVSSTADDQASNKGASVTSNKRRKSCSSVQFPCKYINCGMSLTTDWSLKIHEHMHLGIKPYSCGWPDCATKFRSIQRYVTVAHIRKEHLGMPGRGQTNEQNETEQQQEQQQINPLDYVQVDKDMLHQRLA